MSSSEPYKRRIKELEQARKRYLRRMRALLDHKPEYSDEELTPRAKSIEEQFELVARRVYSWAERDAEKQQKVLDEATPGSPPVLLERTRIRLKLAEKLKEAVWLARGKRASGEDRGES